MSVVILFCGSFNPITIAHLRVVELARRRLERENLRVLSCIISPVNQEYPKQGLCAAKHRLEMCKLATTSSREFIKVSSWEVDRDHWTPTRQTFDHFQELFDTQNGPFGLSSLCDDIQVVGLFGADILSSFSVPNLWADDDIVRLVSHYRMVFALRPGTVVDDAIRENPILAQHRDKFSFVEDLMVSNLSSTIVRQAIADGSPIDYLVTESVQRYIVDNNLYGK